MKNRGKTKKSNVPIPNDFVRQFIDARRVEAELSDIAAELRDVRGLKRDPSVPDKNYVAGLIKRRAELLKRVNISAPPERAAWTSPLDSFVTSTAALFGPATTIWMPYLGPGVEDAPGSVGTSGHLHDASAAFPGRANYRFVVKDDGEDSPHTQKAWFLAFPASIILPEAPETGMMFFWFRIFHGIRFESYAAYDASCHIAGWIGATGDIAKSGPFLGPSRVAWCELVDADPTEHHGGWYGLGGQATVSGSFPVQKGKVPALGFVFFVTLGVASGMLWGDGYLQGTLPGSDLHPEPQELGKLEYRIEPAWWLDAIRTRVSSAVDLG